MIFFFHFEHNFSIFDQKRFLENETLHRLLIFGQFWSAGIWLFYCRRKRFDELLSPPCFFCYFFNVIQFSIDRIHISITYPIFNRSLLTLKMNKFLSDQFSDIKWLWMVTFRTRPAPKSHVGCLMTPLLHYFLQKPSTSLIFHISSFSSSIIFLQILYKSSNFNHTHYTGPQNRK